MSDENVRELADRLAEDIHHYDYDPDAETFDIEAAARRIEAVVVAHNLLIRTAELKRAAAKVRLMAADGKCRSYEDWENEILALIHEGGESALAEHDRKLLEPLVALTDKWSALAAAWDTDGEYNVLQKPVGQIASANVRKCANELLRTIERVR